MTIGQDELLFAGHNFNRYICNRCLAARAGVFLAALLINVALFAPVFVQWGRAFSWMYAR